MGLYYPEAENLPEEEEGKRASELDENEGVKPEAPKGWPFEELYDEGEGTSAGIGGGDTFNLAEGPQGLTQKAQNPLDTLISVERIPGSDDNLEPTIIEHDGSSEDALGAIPVEEGNEMMDKQADEWLREEMERLANEERKRLAKEEKAS